MSDKRVAVSHKVLSQHAQAATSATARGAVSKSEASARWAALDSRHERLVTSSDAVLADLDRSGERRIAS
jgi:hypothetical protein